MPGSRELAQERPDRGPLPQQSHRERPRGADEIPARDPQTRLWCCSPLYAPVQEQGEGRPSKTQGFQARSEHSPRGQNSILSKGPPRSLSSSLRVYEKTLSRLVPWFQIFQGVGGGRSEEPWRYVSPSCRCHAAACLAAFESTAYSRHNQASSPPTPRNMPTDVGKRSFSSHDDVVAQPGFGYASGTHE